MNTNYAAYQQSSFGPAFLFLNQKRRRALAVYYAFCRLMDDIADEPAIPDKQVQLDFWRQEIGRVFGGTPRTKLGQDVQQVARAFEMPSDRFLLLIDGMQADVQARTYATEQELEWYLWRVAGIVGLATLDILGVKGEPAQQLARALGFAVQRTNIVRDVHEDSQRGRVYLPQDLLAQYGLSRADVLQNTSPQKLAAVLRVCAQRAKADYAQAAQLMRTLPRGAMLPCRMMGLVYQANLAKIEKTDFCFTGVIKLSKPEKVKQGLYALFQTYFRA